MRPASRSSRRGTWQPRCSVATARLERCPASAIRTSPGAAVGEAFVLKIANATERREVLDLQNAAMAHLAAHAPRLAVPRVIPGRDGRTIGEVTGDDGRRHFVRLVTWVPGRVLAAVKPHTEALLESLGRAAGEMDAALAAFEHPAMHREFPWDLAQTLRMRGELERVVGPERRALLAAALDRFEREVQPRPPAAAPAGRPRRLERLQRAGRARNQSRTQFRRALAKLSPGLVFRASRGLRRHAALDRRGRSGRLLRVLDARQARAGGRRGGDRSRLSRAHGHCRRTSSPSCSS